jgi:hypothetical protein
MAQFTLLNPLLQSFLCSAYEAQAILDEARWTLQYKPLSSMQLKRLKESRDRLEWEMARLARLHLAGNMSCTTAACLMEKFLIKLECFREAAYLGPPGGETDGIVAGLYDECIGAREIFLSHVKLHKCSLSPERSAPTRPVNPSVKGFENRRIAEHPVA